MNRFNLQKEILGEGLYFKTICGAGNEDVEEVYRLTLVYTLAGTLGVDVSANPEAVAAAKRAIQDAKKMAKDFDMPLVIEPFINVSIGMKGDPHVRKAEIIAENCTRCNECIETCPSQAIPDELVVVRERCIGCGTCAVTCPVDAIRFVHNAIDIENVLKQCVAQGAENFELHASVVDHEPTLAEWELMSTLLPDGFLSLCTDRQFLSNHELISRIEQMLKITPGRIIVQADGIPMSGGTDDYNTTLQAVATADIVVKSQLPVYTLLSGGTNAKTIELSQLCGVPSAGVAIGTFARKKVYPFINNPDFPSEKVLREAVKTARDLVSTCCTLDQYNDFAKRVLRG